MALEFASSELELARGALTVSALNRAVAGLLERGFPLLWVRGEIANLTRAASGHWYFVLKDDGAQVRCVMFRSRSQLMDWTPSEGDEIEARVLITLYQPRGEFQLNVEFMRRAGQGRLFEEFLRLKARLAAEGVFDEARKRPLPRFPQRVGIVTSLQAAALRDVLSALERRARYLQIIVYPVTVQGAQAGARIAAMLATASQRAEVDVLLLVRGGGSIEDLWSFNEESVARAIRACAVPVVVGVGHESDFTIADFAADLRAPTPTAAAELVAPEHQTLLDVLSAALERIGRVLRHALDSAAQRLDYAQRALAMPRAPLVAVDARVGMLRVRSLAALTDKLASAHARLRQQQAALGRSRPHTRREQSALVFSRLAASLQVRVQARHQRLAQLAARMHALNPQAVLDRGYAIALDRAGHAITSAAKLSVGEPLRIVFAAGTAQTRVEATDSGSGDQLPS